MKSVARTRRQARLRRHARIRRKVKGTAERPRLAVRRSLRNIYAQVIDDDAARTIVSISTLDKEAKAALSGVSRMEQSAKLGQLIAERVKEKGIESVAFDRGGYLYHGHIKALADGARKAGLEL